jgi:hypothetical protein
MANMRMFEGHWIAAGSTYCIHKGHYSLCEWESMARDKVCQTLHWPDRELLQTGSKNFSNVGLVHSELILFHTSASNWE